MNACEPFARKTGSLYGKVTGRENEITALTWRTLSNPDQASWGF